MKSSISDLGFYAPCNPLGQGESLWPYYPDAKIERFNFQVESEILSKPVVSVLKIIVGDHHTCSCNFRSRGGLSDQSRSMI